MDRPQERDTELEELLDTLDERLRSAGADSAERAFGISCLLGLLPALGVIVVLFLIKIINVILAFVLVGLSSLAILGGAMLLSYQARQNSINREYHRSVKADIDQFLSDRNLSQPQFDRLVLPLLPEVSPLAGFLLQDSLMSNAQGVSEHEELA